MREPGAHSLLARARVGLRWAEGFGCAGRGNRGRAQARKVTQFNRVLLPIGENRSPGKGRPPGASLPETVVAIWLVQLFLKLMVFFSDKEGRWHSCSPTGKFGFSIRTTPRSQSGLRGLWRATVGLTFLCVPLARHRRVLEPGHSVGIQSSILANFSAGFLALPPIVRPQSLPFLLRS